jgi:hypothetical protein
MIEEAKKRCCYQRRYHYSYQLLKQEKFLCGMGSRVRNLFFPECSPLHRLYCVVVDPPCDELIHCMSEDLKN